MHVFVTGATGYIGSAVVRELIGAGYSVTGLCRSEEKAAGLREAGAEPAYGTLDDLDTLRRAAAAADGVIHLAFTNDFSDFEGALALDLQAVEAMGAALEGSGKPFITTAHANGHAVDRAVLAWAERGTRSSIVSLAPSVHGEGDKGFVPMMIDIAREKGFAAYVGDGSNRWPAIHRLDAAVLYRLALESAPTGSRLLGAGDEGIPLREIAAVIGQHLNVPALSISPEEAAAHFGFLGPIAALDITSLYDTAQASLATRELLGWKAIHPGLIADLEAGHYFASNRSIFR
ncbi:SDR family oxidoreductase [Paenibacillus glycinis]|uniref:NAD-dependent epimerase/dehydratase family protein n=1 Tax=Paenibacillus glycinis TaxID=2697035 RepID=A0ABW9XQJ0_9BACL|nr:SDR family oxidoreductase [Paenibacillus glycinis]NBD24913.1 NAD-dependent epimerase/dehydratase family protein [Paenibacillus glycinis]